MLNELGPDLEICRDGIWRPASGASVNVSYPECGNRRCAELESDSFWFAHRNRIIGDMLQLDPFPRAGVFLDVGGGNGFVSVYLQESLGLQTVLLEPGADGARTARDRGVRHVVQCTLEEAGLKERCVGAVGLFDVVEHIEDDVGFLDLCKRILVDDGRVYITVPAFGWLWSDADVRSGHFRRYTIEKLERSLDRAGLQLSHASYFFSTILLPVLFLRAIPWRLGKGRSAGHVQEAPQRHRIESGLLRKSLSTLNDLERRRLCAGLSVPCGTSIVCAARKPISTA